MRGAVGCAVPTPPVKPRRRRRSRSSSPTPTSPARASGFANTRRASSGGSSKRRRLRRPQPRRSRSPPRKWPLQLARRLRNRLRAGTILCGFLQASCWMRLGWRSVATTGHKHWRPKTTAYCNIAGAGRKAERWPVLRYCCRASSARVESPVFWRAIFWISALKTVSNLGRLVLRGAHYCHSCCRGDQVCGCREGDRSSGRDPGHDH